ncbi:carbon-nitrogen hydrolase family protein [Marinomonas ostreistagni]|uniref:carbon-nitrogen hydrolase family protein n=1 Tax=Marinomonas ostreistagni TaxID=359209 RepID=UPI001950761B|nr:carbon-nitrogen hydrolase family protein [Marinomonas ostreistagni]MBM6549847.1 carbon-nitrogen hydrolase family protein [Marinomonas ostreistagni]
MSKLTIACLQLTSQADWQRNLKQILEHMKACLSDSPRLIVLPENAFLFDAKQLREVAEGQATQDIMAAMQAFAKAHQVYVLIGSHPLATRPDGEPVSAGRVRQTSLMIDDQGEVVARYDKVHLFDVTVDDKASVYQESRFIEPGEVQAVTVDIDDVRVGLSICYDLRFPEFYRLLADQGAQVCFVPSAFTHRTGEAHWHCLLQARAIENQLYMAGVNQVGWHTSTRQTYGNTVAYSPWGKCLGKLDDEQTGHLSFTVDSAELEVVRQAMPCLQHRRVGR